MLKPHNFREFFVLVDNPINKTNTKAVYKFCALKNGGIQAAASKSECFTTNKGNLSKDKQKTLNKGKM
ncbi:11271_t:CDS:2 [Dentiscutata erythropus]|uniref:11271_t:CDS:1 n=1 Tax=Dentiscutata erythropus TaxID=1348616 RepID=A0A9N9NMG1_9GLOM|nr:11271_t:CDS:2 [Dentiscutata erythropus]